MLTFPRNKLGLNDWIKETVEAEEAKKAKDEAKKASKNKDKTDGSPDS